MSDPTFYTPRPIAWYTRYPEPPWGVECTDCGTLDVGLDKLEALVAADQHAWEVHNVRQPVEPEDFTEALAEKVREHFRHGQLQVPEELPPVGPSVVLCLAHLEAEPCQTCAAYIAAGL